jgi:ComF family protein
MAWFETLRRRAATWAGRGLDLLCPPRCAVCGTEPEAVDDGMADERAAGVFICPACERSLVDRDARCRHCATRCPEGLDCDRCRRSRPDWEGLVVLGGYGDELRTAVLRAKRPGAESVAAALGRLIVRRHRDTLAEWHSDAVVPVPMHWSRRALRGTNAAEEIALQVAADLRLPCRRLLRRTRATPMQNELPFADRPANVHGAFRPRRGVAGLRLLLVDDVVTTGGTLAECRRALAGAGATAVHAVAAARAERSTETRDEDV